MDFGNNDMSGGGKEKTGLPDGNDVRDASFVAEPARQVPVAGRYDVIVAGGGPAGVCAALAAAERGCSVLLLEAEGCLGGILTSGLMSNILDAKNKGGLLKSILAELSGMGMASGHHACVDPEAMKIVLENRVRRAGIHVRLRTRVAGAKVSSARRVEAVFTESCSGREAWIGKVFVDATGNGDLGALSGCGYELGDPDGRIQAASLCALIYGVGAGAIPDLLEIEKDGGKRRLYELLDQAGRRPSYSKPTLFSLNENGFLLMSNHQYRVYPDDADALTDAVLQARAEIWEQIAALRRTDPRLAKLRIGTTAAALGLREGRRISALYRVVLDDLREGRSQPDPVCRGTFSVDVHGMFPGNSGYTSAGFKVRPYDIPLRALIARDAVNLLLAGRCICGDVYAHASYRVVGNAAPIGEAAGICAALAVRQDLPPEEVSYADFVQAGGNPHPHV
ncbi:MAG: FAD-dependent oxidoreductase [Lentisphaeria bacterium]|nr:FAD-dependent oxidoreductase [Lentisphaeria bacterium]